MNLLQIYTIVIVAVLLIMGMITVFGGICPLMITQNQTMVYFKNKI